ncbi:MAG: TauD/TfdA family dioxygenase [Alphaproteobacteria bacterium]|nr:TauD/TfdA family dioxygenase [Alphaproteobacteria bacterium]
MGIEVRKLGGPMLAEIVGADVSKPLSEADKAIVNQAFIDHCVLVFRDQFMEPPEVLELSNAFGPVEPHITVKYRHPEYPDLIVMTNMNEKGEIDAHETARGVGWHTDMCYMPLPAKATLLHTIEIPETGGDTYFANMYMALEEMPADLRDRIEGLRATFRYGGRAAERNLRLEKEDQDKPLQDHPIVKRHRESGRESLFVNPTHTVGILGWEDQAAQGLLQEVYEWAGQERFQACHVWRSGDTVIWDNRCCWHSATGENPLRQPRRFYRATIADRAH